MTQPANTEQIAAAFVAARRGAHALSDYPGPQPASLAEGYAIQTAAIHFWREPVAGWKVGRIPEQYEGPLGCDRLAGPIFAPTVRYADSDDNGPVPDMPVFVGGFAAIEAEFVAVLGADVAPLKRRWSRADTLAAVADLRIGLEIASSPLATINDLGPCVVVSDFGNNYGLIVGPSIAQWQTRDLESLRCVARVDDQIAGSGGAFNLTGGWLRSVQFLLELAAERDISLPAGTLIATGQTSGIHDVLPGQRGCVDFGDDGRIDCAMTAAGEDSI